MDEILNEASQETMNYLNALFEAFEDVPADAPEHEVRQLLDEWKKPRN